MVCLFCRRAAPALVAALLAPAAHGQLASWQGYATASPLSAPSFAVPGPQSLPVAPPPVYSSFGLEAREAWTDNVYLVASGTALNGGHSADRLTILSPSVVTVVTTRTVNLAVNYSGSYNWYLSNKDLDGFNHNGVGTLKAELLEQELYLDADTAIIQQASNPSGANTAESRTQNANRTQTIANQVGPRWQEELFDGIVAQALYSYGLTRNFTPAPAASGPLISLQQPITPNNTALRHGRVELRNSGSSSAYQWTYSSDDSATSQPGQSFKKLAHQLAGEFHLDEDWGLLATIGTEHVQGEQLGPGLSGWYYNGGIHWSPSPNTDLRLVDGRREGKSDLQALLDYKIGPRTDFRLSRTVSLTTDGTTLFNNLSTLQHDVQGNFVNPFNGLANSALGSSGSVNNSVYHLQSLQMSLSHGDSTDRFSLNGQSTTQTPAAQTAPGNILSSGLLTPSGTLGLSASWSHQIDGATNFSVNLGENRNLSSGLGIVAGKTLSAQFAWNHALNPYITISGNFRLNDTLYQDSDGNVVQSTVAQGRVKEDYAYIGVRRSF